VWQWFCDRFLKRPLLTVSRSFINVANSVLWRMAIILKANKVNLFVSSVLFVLWYHSPNFLDTPRMYFLFFSIFSPTCFGCYLHPTSGTRVIRCSSCSWGWVQIAPETCTAEIERNKEYI
jgi:hypothetical protein